MGNTDRNKAKKYRRKIRIRLRDPSIPDSYVCEIFDSSLENEQSTNNESEEVGDASKPKDYFELLMSKGCKKKQNLKGNHKVDEEDESNQKIKKNSKETRNSLHQALDLDKEEIKSETDTSDDENLLQFKQKNTLQNLPEGGGNDVIHLAKETTTSGKINIGSDIFTVIESPKIGLHHKKSFSILSYFSKSEANFKSRIKSELTVQDSLKTIQSANSLKVVKKQDCEIIQNDKKIFLNGINKENVKLAPLFYKKGARVIDSAKQKARLEFLYKESSLIKKPEARSCDSVIIFPTIPHVQQRNDSACWSRRKISLPLPEVQYLGEYTFNSKKIFSLQIENLHTIQHVEKNYQTTADKDFLCKLKCKYLDLNLDSLINGLKEKQDKFLARAKEIEKSKNSEKKGSSDGFEELNTLWTDKYKPKSNEILGNENTVKKLKKWLQSWKSFDEELKVLVKSNRTLKSNKDSDDDSECFLDPDSQSYGLRAPGNVCIISGPNGCGKTALVYALAGELEFGVLELNASSKRTGKKVFSDVQEATQSHKVQRVNLLQTDLLKKESKRKRNSRRKKNRKVETPAEALDQTNDCKISLILIEDANIVFEEHDEGFFSAISSLVQTSKRPLIFLSDEPNCHYLYNFKAEQCLLLEMEPPSPYTSCAILDVVSALEGANLDKELLESLVRENHFDLRRSLLQLQFWMHYLKNSVEKRFDLGLLWWGLSKFLFKQGIRHFVRAKGRKRKRVNDLFDSSDEELETAKKKHKTGSTYSKKPSTVGICDLHKEPNLSIESYFRVLDLVSTLDRFFLPGSQEPVPGSQCKLKDSLSLEENMEDASWMGKSISEEISGELIGLSARIFAHELKEKNNDSRKLDFVSPCWEEIRWRNSQEKASEALSLLVYQQRGRDNRSLHLDYLPILRNICRAERNRSEMNPKRKNRFYHYLNNLGLELTDENLEINCDILERR